MNPALHAEILAEVRRDIGALEQQLQELRSVEAYHASKARNTADAGTNGHSSKTEPTFTGAHNNRFADSGQREAAIRVLRETGRPMRAGDIAREMMAGGYPYEQGVAKLANSLFTSFTRGPALFEKAGKGLWTLVSDSATPEESDE